MAFYVVGCNVDRELTSDFPHRDHFKLTCLNCTASGSLQIVAGGFTVNSGTVDEVIDFFDNGYLQLAASGIRANVSLQLGLEPGISGTINLVPPFPITRIRPVTVRFSFVPDVFKLTLTNTSSY